MASHETRMVGAKTSDVKQKATTMLPVSDAKQEAAATLPATDVKQQTTVTLPVSDVEEKTTVKLPLSDVKRQTTVTLPVSDVEQQTTATSFGAGSAKECVVTGSAPSLKAEPPTCHVTQTNSGNLDLPVLGDNCLS